LNCSTPELEALPADMELIQHHGVEQVRGPHVKHLEGALWEMRVKAKDGIALAIDVAPRSR
jgi:hypothetical protein